MFPSVITVAELYSRGQIGWQGSGALGAARASQRQKTEASAEVCKVCTARLVQQTRVHQGPIIQEDK